MIRTFRSACRMHLDLLRTQDRLRCRPGLETRRRIRRADEHRRRCSRRKCFVLVDGGNALKDTIAERARRRDCAPHFRQRWSRRALGHRRGDTLVRGRLRKTLVKLSVRRRTEPGGTLDGIGRDRRNAKQHGGNHFCHAVRLAVRLHEWGGTLEKRADQKLTSICHLMITVSFQFGTKHRLSNFGTNSGACYPL